MAECIVCGKNLNFWQGDHNRRCDECVNASLWPEGHPNHNADIASRKEQSDSEKLSIDSVVLTTETAPNLKERLINDFGFTWIAS